MRVLSGIQPSGELHIGNYLGALRQHVALQEKGEGLYFIADYHSMTSLRDAAARRRLVRDVALDYLACGLDPERTILYRQSDVPEVCELQWILGSVTPMGLLERSVSYKDKIANGLSVDHGLFAYPVLMAADILLYHSDLVPIGQDQKQHLEMTRDIATRFNHAYATEVFRLPEPHILEDVAVVPGVDGRKMSKSYDNTLRMFWPEKKLNPSKTLNRSPEMRRQLLRRSELRLPTPSLVLSWMHRRTLNPKALRPRRMPKRPSGLKRPS